MTLIKLIRKYLIIAIIAVVAIGCISHLFIFRFFIHYSTDKMLSEQQKLIENYVAANDTLSLAWEIVLEPARIEKRVIDNLDLYPRPVFKDTLLYNENSGSLIPYRQLYFVISYKGQHHLVNINQPTIISNDLYYAIITSLLVLVILFILLTYIISYLLRRNVWMPLSQNLELLKNYDLKANTKLDLQNPGIVEFDEINWVIMRMVEKINDDYENTRIFTEDASHEMQTPLSIIKSKLDLLIQNPSIMDDAYQSQAISAISRAVIRLSQLNKSLLLISKINNNQYKEVKATRIDFLITTYLTDMEELIDNKGLKVKRNINECTIQINPILSEILVSNLLSNAIRHNIDNGAIDIEITSSFLRIINSCEVGDQLADLFMRTVKRNRKEDSLGLGLSIVKSICDKNGFQISYNYPASDMFGITIFFNL